MNRPCRSDFDRICRLCLNVTDLVAIFERHPKTQKESLSLLVRETVEMLGLTIEPDDGFPKKMCIICKDFLRTLYKFRNQCQEANDLLVEAYSAPNEQQIAKHEPPPLEVPEPRIQIIPQSSLRETEIVHQPKPSSTQIVAQNEEPAVSIEGTTREADSSSGLQQPMCIKVESVDVQESAEFLESAESFTEEYEYLDAEPEDIEEEIEVEVVHEEAIEAVQEECENDASEVLLPDEQNVEIIVEEENPDDSGETEEEDIPQESTKASSSKVQLCKVCGKHSTCMKYHLMCHTGERPFSCGYCDKSFRTSTKLNIHVNGVHLKVRKYECDVCNKKFLDAGNLRNHKVTHGGERKYICDIDGCGKSFALPGTLRVHKKTHTQDKQFSCGFCSKLFLYKWLLVKHLRSHTGEKPYECDVCHKKFITITHMHTHKKTHDPNRERSTRRGKTVTKKIIQVKQEDSDTSEINSSEK